MSKTARTLRTVTIQAGLGNPSTSGKLADLLEREFLAAASTKGITVEHTRIDLRDLGTDIAIALLNPVKPKSVVAALETLQAADVLIAVTPTFNTSYAGLFKSFFDLVEPGILGGKVTILGATGGTARHSLVIDNAMRPLFAYLGTHAVPTGIFAAAEDFAGTTRIAERAMRVSQDALILLQATAPEIFHKTGTFQEVGIADAVEQVDSRQSETVSAQDALAARNALKEANMPLGTPTLHSEFGEFVDFSKIIERL